MSKAEEFLKNEKNLYGKIYVDITYAIDNIAPFLQQDVLKERKYIVKLPHLRKYIELIESAEKELPKEGLFNIFKGDKYLDLLETYKEDNKEDLLQLEKCSHCACLSCSATCKFDSCLGCRNGSHIQQCDHNKMNVILHDNFILDLTNNNSGESDKYLVLATLQNVEKDQRYIIIQNIISKEKFILYYYPGISEDSYGEISDAKEFDFIVSTFEGCDY